MRSRLFPVIVTAAITSLGTYFIAAHFQKQVPYFGMAPDHSSSLVHYTANDGNVGNTAAPVNFESAAASSVNAVVHVKTTTRARTVTSNNINDVYAQLFGPRQYYIPSQVESGSGVVISPDGCIVTNNHVVANGDEVEVTFNDRLTKKAKVVNADPSTDIALLKVEGEQNLAFIEFGNSDNVKLGQWVLAVGYPLSLDATVTAGIVSAKGRSLGINDKQSAAAIESFIQTDAAVNPGNSGGALVNTAGQLIGINSAIASPTGSYAGYSYAIPANIVRKVVNDMMKYGSVQRAYMGISYIDSKSVTPEKAKELGLDRNEGVYVENVLANSGAAAAGIKNGDFITHINGQVITNKPQLQEQIARFQPGDNISVTYTRAGKPNTVSVKLTNLNGTTDIIKAENPVKILGASFRPLTDKEKNTYNVEGGVMVTDPGRGTLARQTQMNKGFVITGINDIPVKTVNDLRQAMAASRNMQIAGFQPGYRGMYYYGLNNINALDEE